MKTILKGAAVVLLSLTLASCGFDINFGAGKAGNGVIAEQTRSLSDEFTEVYAAEGLDVFVAQGSDFEVRVEADENIIDLIATDVKNGRLRVHTTENIGNATKNVYVTLPVVNGLASSSGADLEVKGTIEADEIELDASSGSDLVAAIKAKSVEADASSGAMIQITGEAAQLSADASSGSNIRAQDFETKNCTASASSGADVRIFVTESLTANASSGGNINYKGDPRVAQNKSVSGNVSKF